MIETPALGLDLFRGAAAARSPVTMLEFRNLGFRAAVPVATPAYHKSIATKQ
jgi:hypothetical protein